MTKKIKLSKDMGLGDLASILGMTGSHKGIFSGYRLGGVKIGQKAVVLGKGVNMKGHEPQAKYASLSDGSKLVLVGPNKGMRIK